MISAVTGYKHRVSGCICGKQKSKRTVSTSRPSLNFFFLNSLLFAFLSSSVSLLKNSLSPLVSSLDPSTKCLPSSTASLSSTPKLSLLCLPHFPNSPSFSLCFVRAFDDGTRDRPYGHCLVARINKYPSKVIRKDSSKKTAKKSRVKVFVKLGFNYDEILELCNTLPALELCYSLSQKFMDEQQKLPENAEAATTDSFSSVASPIANGQAS